MNFNVAQFVAERLIKAVTDNMGYNLPPERVSRIATEAIKIQYAYANEKGASLLSLAVAIDLDFLLWGDPNASQGIVGFHGIITEVKS